jgi:hypothetical protein
MRSPRSALCVALTCATACAAVPRAPHRFDPLRDADLPYEMGGLWTRPDGEGGAAQSKRAFRRTFAPTIVHEADTLLWSAECDAHFDWAYVPPARQVCRFTATSSTVRDVSVVLIGNDLRRLDGFAIVGTATVTDTWTVLHDPAERTAVMTSSTSRLVARVGLTTEKLEVADDLSVDENRLAELIGLAVCATPNVAPPRRATIPGVRTATIAETTTSTRSDPLRIASVAPDQRFEPHARHLDALGNPAHAAALRASAGARLAGPPPEPTQPVRREPDPAGEIGFGIGFDAGPTFPIASADVKLRQGAQLSVPMFVELEQRLQIILAVGTYARTLDGARTARTAGFDGTIDPISGYQRGGTSVQGVGSLALGARYTLTDGALQPYVGLFGGTRFEAHELVDAARSYRIRIVMPGVQIAPVVGVRHTVWRSRALSVDIRGELVGQATFQRSPVLDFEGDSSAAALDAYERLRALDFGGPAFQLAVALGLDLRIELFRVR